MVRRRELLQGLATVVTTGVLAGCGGVNEEGGTQTQSEDPAEEDDGQQDEPERVAEPAPERVPDRIEFPDLSADDPTYRRWIPTRAEFDFGLGGGAVNLRRARERRTEIPPETYEEATGIIAESEYFGVDYHLLDGMLVSLDKGLLVYPGEFDRSVIDETLGSTGHEVLESRGDVSFYRNSERDTEFAVGNQGVIERWIGDGKSFADDAMMLFETAAGEHPRRHETDTLFRRFTADVGWPLSVTFPQPIGDGEFSGGVKNVIPETVLDSAHLGFAQYGSRERVVDRMWVATPGDETGSALIRASFEDASFAEFAEDDQDVAVRHDDGISEVAAVRSHESGGWGAGPPLVTLSATVEDGQLVLANLAGDRLPLERLTVSAGEAEYQPEGTLAPGDTVRLDVAAGEGSVAVSYISPNANYTTRLATVEGDERRPLAGESAETTLVKSIRTY